MGRGGARPGAGRPARKSANTSTVSTRARARAREATDNQRPWPADKVERWPVDRLIPYAKNARTHSDAQIGVGLDDAGAGGRGRRTDCRPCQAQRQALGRQNAELEKLKEQRYECLIQVPSRLDLAMLVIRDAILRANCVTPVTTIQKQTQITGPRNIGGISDGRSEANTTSGACRKLLATGSVG
jgi:hypothetical protein